MNAVVYKSKVDFWMLTMFGFAALLCAVVASGVMHGPGMVRLLLLPLLALGMGLPAWTVLMTRYTLTDEALLVRSGPFAWRIALRDVARIAATRDAGSSPALSLDRLRIEYGEARALMISPAEKDRFVRDITARRAHLRPAGSSARSPM
jgi:hypothetical protein